MIKNNWGNIKIHFAGADGAIGHHIALKVAGVNYRLYSCFRFINNKNKQNSFLLPENNAIILQDKEDKHIIQDSGLYTLMFGAGKGRKITHDFLKDWQDKLIKFVLENNLKSTCVEIDCQKLLGPEEAWYFRRRMKELLPNRQINVFHMEDGKDGLDRLIDFSDYIAFSVPELRILKPKTYKKDAVKLAKYAKKCKPSIDIHMLGCTEYSMLKDLVFCTSADSTSWLAGVQYGHYSDGIKHSYIKQFREDIFEKRKKEIARAFEEMNIDIKNKNLASTTNASICATICKNRYTSLAGSQE